MNLLELQYASKPVIVLHCFVRAYFISAWRDKVPGFGHFPATTPHHHPATALPHIPPWYLGASHEYQHGRACPTTEPRPTSLVTHKHTHMNPPLSPALCCRVVCFLLCSHTYTYCVLANQRAHTTAATHSCTFAQASSS